MIVTFKFNPDVNDLKKNRDKGVWGIVVSRCGGVDGFELFAHPNNREVKQKLPDDTIIVLNAWVRNYRLKRRQLHLFIIPTRNDTKYNLERVEFTPVPRDKKSFFDAIKYSFSCPVPSKIKCVAYYRATDVEFDIVNELDNYSHTFR